MNSGSSALISTGGQSLETLTSSSCSQTSRPAVIETWPPVRRTTSTFSSPLHFFSASSVFFFSGTVLPARSPFIRRDDELARGIVDAARQAVRREATEHHGMHRADAGAGEHRVGRFRDHRQVDRDAVALLDAVRLQHVGDLADALVQLPVGDLLVLGRVVAFPDDRDLISLLLQMAVDAVGGHVERAVLVPLDRDVIGRE